MRILSFSELKSDKGIKFSRQHVHRLVQAGRFPRPVKVGENTNGWIEGEIDTYLIECVKRRDQPQTFVAA
jgi:prophage regulatory protein